MFVCFLRNTVPDTIQVVSRISLLILNPSLIPRPRASKTSLCNGVFGESTGFFLSALVKRGLTCNTSTTAGAQVDSVAVQGLSEWNPELVSEVE